MTGAQCGNPARWDLRGGPPAMAVPTATNSYDGRRAQLWRSVCTVGVSTDATDEQRQRHYADGKEASPQLYPKMTAEDRRLRLRGYEVYRFGGFELSQPQAAATLRPRCQGRAVGQHACWVSGRRQTAP